MRYQNLIIMKNELGRIVAIVYDLCLNRSANSCYINLTIMNGRPIRTMSVNLYDIKSSELLLTKQISKLTHAA